MEIKEKELLEGKKIDDLDGTSTSEEIVEENAEAVPELNSTPVPTDEEKENAGIEPLATPEESVEEQSEPAIEEPVPAEPIETQSDAIGVTETIESEPVEQPQMHEELGVTEVPATQAFKFTQDDMDDLAGKVRMETRNKTFRYIYDRYGVKDEQELDDLIGNAQRYDSLQEQYDGDKKMWKQESDVRNKELADVKEQVALMQSGIDSERYEDAKLILKGKGLEVTLENIQSELNTHPEWKKVNELNNNPNFTKVSESTIEPKETEGKISKLPVLGNENLTGGKESEEDIVMKRLFKL